MPPPPPSKGRPSGDKSDANAPKSNARNEYIPSFIAKKPFYIDDATQSQDDYLEHQRLQSEKNSDPLATSAWYDRGAKAGPRATKYRKGACENCGSMSHKAKECLQRKRKAGARWTGRDIAADEVVGDVRLGWDAKRDRWNGFEAGEYGGVVEEFRAVEELKRRAGAEGEGEGDREREGGDEAEREEGDRYEAETDMGRQQSTSTRNLRLREDTAKYLLNLDLDSAKYDPKTRSMLDTETSTNELIAEDGFQKQSGDAGEFESAQQYAWETQERGDAAKLHMQANPTEALLLRKRKADDDAARGEARKKALVDKYGEQTAVKKNPLAGADVTSNERYVEYDKRGKIKGAPERKEKSMYAEDVRVNNHTSTWGSWWRGFTWGYACCHSTVKNSFCTGEEGKTAVEEAEKFAKGLLLPETHEAGEEAREEEAEVESGANGAEKPQKEKRGMDESRKRLEELKAGVSEEQMETYRREKTNQNDPMAKMLGKDELTG